MFDDVGDFGEVGSFCVAKAGAKLDARSNNGSAADVDASALGAVRQL